MIKTPIRLEAENLACERGGRVVFSGLSFAAAGGEAVEVVGPNGTGKSSLLRLVAGLVRVTAGEMRLIGGDAEKTLAEQAHYCGHQDALKPSLTVLENLAFWTSWLGGGGLSPLDALALWGMEGIADSPAAYLSAGQKRRLALSRLLTVKRPVWLLDEPTAALDVASQAKLATIMQTHVAAGGLILAATHGPLGLPCRALRVDGAGSS